MNEKQALRNRMRKLRRAHVAALPAATRALLFLRPPAALLPLVPPGAVVGLYHATAHEAPAMGYARWWHENGRRIALPWFDGAQGQMRFREWRNPHDESELVPGPHGRQPADAAAELVPELVFVPTLAFTPDGDRLGQGGGHYDRWLAQHPQAIAVGLAWDAQMIDALPVEPHDRPLRAIITPTRIWGDLA